MQEPVWRPTPGAGTPVEVAAAEARDAEAGFPVGDAAFASPDTGWVFVGDGLTARCRILFTQDAGATWRPQLAWKGLFDGRLNVFDDRQAAFSFSLSQSDDINGYRPEPHAPDDPFIGPDPFLAGTQDAGATWRLVPPPPAFGSYFQTPERIWLKSHVHGAGSMGRFDLLRTVDGGVTWQRREGTDSLSAMSLSFQSESDGLLMAPYEGDWADLLYRTEDGGTRWQREALARPTGLRGKPEVRLDPVVRRDGGLLLVLWVQSASVSERRPPWEGTYLYVERGSGDRGFDGPYRLPEPTVPSRWPHAVACGADGRLWAGSGREVFVADDPAGPWERRDLPLPEEQHVFRIDPVGDGVVWLGSTKFNVLANPSGQLYRSADDGMHWQRLL